MYCYTFDVNFFFHGNHKFMINNKRSAETNILFIFNNKLLYKALKSHLTFDVCEKYPHGLVIIILCIVSNL